MSRLGQPYCPACDVPVGTQSADEVIEKLMAHPAGHEALRHGAAGDRGGRAVRDALGAEPGRRLRPHPRRRPDLFGRSAAGNRPPAEAPRRGGGRSRDGAARGPLAASPAAWKTPWPWAAACSAWPIPKRTCPSRSGPRETHSQHFACHRCGRSFEPLGPHHFSFNSPLGWCPGCEGLGVQTGTNPAALLRDPKLTLAEGAVALWPAGRQPPLPRHARRLRPRHRRAPGRPLRATRRQAPPPGHARHRRTMVRRDLPSPSGRGAGGEGRGEGRTERVSSVVRPHPRSLSRRERGDYCFRFQYKGLYPALEEASRVSPSFRNRLEHLVEEVECTICGGSRLRDDAAAMRLRDRTIDDYCRLPLGKLLAELRAWKPDGRPAQDRRRSAPRDLPTACSSSSTWGWTT